uniref:Uncharacterized protein n=1 Tax=Globodera rostochiensis TaxID=31243 RepID=A0A914HRV8_GLORO
MFWETVPKEGKIQLALIKEFRSLAEVTRYGAEEEKRNVQADGKFKPCGVRETIKFLREVFGMITPDKAFTLPKPVAKNVPSHSVEAQNYQFRFSNRVSTFVDEDATAEGRGRTRSQLPDRQIATEDSGFLEAGDWTL